MTKQRILCLILACVLLLGAILVPVLSGLRPESDRSVSDYFYIQIYGSDDQVVSKYKVNLDGRISGKTREITALTLSLDAGDQCETEYRIDGSDAFVKLTHPVEGYLLRQFTLGADGVFSAQ
ncbi:MAG: hypothetical protein Q4F17_02695 [Eubacteriales bacterium]|nr:hypothetical protein [Eubacteriales bacterium]